VRAGILDWYIGEIHVVASDVLPNAGGDGLRDGSARDAFVAEVRGYYKRLEEGAERKSERLSMAKHFRRAREAAERLADGELSPGQEAQETAKVVKAVEILETLSKPGPASTQQEKRTREAAKDPGVARECRETRRLLQQSGLLEKLSPKPEKTPQPKKRTKNATKPGSPSANGTDGQPPGGHAVEAFQAKVARKFPRLQELGLTPTQIEGVLTVIRELFDEA